MKLKDIEVDFKFTDADCIERLENAIKNVQEKAKLKERENLSLSESIRQECEILDTFFDEVFGEGIAKKIFDGKNKFRSDSACYAV